jgi:hypothetical protein
MWRSGGSKTESVPSTLPAPKSRLRGPYRLLLAMAVLFIAVVFVFPIVFAPRVDVPTVVQFASPSSMSVQISNQNLTPLTDVEYGCEVSKLTLANGSAVKDAKILIRGTIRNIPGRRAIRAPCRAAYLLGAPLQAAEYRLTLTYRAYPWPQRRTSVYDIAAQFNSNGQVTGWKLK